MEFEIFAHNCYDNDVTEEHENQKPGVNAALIVIGLTMAALANTLDLPAPAQLLLGAAAVGVLLWVFVRVARKQG